jgi:hypothetical protein
MWAFITCLQGEEVVFRQQSLKLKVGIQKKKAPKNLVMQARIDELATRFSNDDIDRTELLEGLSLLVAQKK